MGIFKFFSSRIPSKPRNKDLQTNGSVNVSVQKNVGMRTENASTIVQNVIAPENRKGKITITDLLQIPVAEIGANDTYLVYSSGSDEAGWHTGGQFEYDGEMYDDGTFFLWSIDRWVAVYKDNQTEEKQPTLFNPLQKIVSLITKTFAQSSYYNLPGRYKAGIPIAEVRKYELDEAGVYQEKTESQSGTYAAETSVMTLVVPYAHSYVQGGVTVYEGGALTAADYEKLCTGGGGQPQPSGGNVDDVQVNGASVVEDRVANIDLAAYLNPYATQSWVSSQGFLKSVPSSYATQSWVQSQGYVKYDTANVICVWRAIYDSTGKWFKFGEIKKSSDHTGFSCELIANDGNQYISAKFNVAFRTQSEIPSQRNYCTLIANVTDYRFFSSNDSLSSFPALDFGYKFVDGHTCELYIRKGGTVNFGNINISAINIQSNINGGGQPSDYSWVTTANSVAQLTEGTDVTAFDRKGVALANVATSVDWSGVIGKPTIQIKSDYVRFEQSGQYASYTFSTTSSRGATLSNRTSSTSGTNNLHICVNITGLTTTAEYNAYLLTHRVSLVFCGKDASGNVIQMEALRNVSVNQIGTDVYFILQLESGKVFDPSSYPNTFNVVFTPID